MVQEESNVGLAATAAFPVAFEGSMIPFEVKHIISGTSKQMAWIFTSSSFHYTYRFLGDNDQFSLTSVTAC